LSATAGLPAEVQAGIGRKGRTPAATVRFYPEAIALYRSAGYQPIAHHWFEKELG
jgi:hypothetical protein